ncbi:NlpC/P60 family protein [Nocardiopsis sp. NPDC050513]|uniref:C40 family peptidase n=1 Tax=Nocardiopsis sp. NPDC050513 TaxID=3364338 RepID=UPI00378B954F
MRGAVTRLWGRVLAFLLPPRGRGGDLGAAAARVGGGATGLAVMAGIAFVSTMCGPGGATASGFTSAESASSGGVVQASLSTSANRTVITISSHGERGSSQKTVRVDIPENILRAHRTAAEAYGLPWEIVAAVGAIETQNGQYVSSDPNWHSGLVEGQRNPYGAAGIVQFGVLDPETGRAGGRLGSAGNAWGGMPKEPVSARDYHYEVGEMPGNPRYFGIDGNDDGMVNVWDPWDNIASGAFRLAYYANQAEQRGSAAVCGSGRGDLTPIECTIFMHNRARWYVDQVLEVAEYYSGSGIAPTSPSLNIQTVSASDSDQDCPPGGGGVDQAAFLGNAGEGHRAAVQTARSKIGLPYVWGGTGPDGYDCSGLTQAAWRAAGVEIPRVSQTQWNPRHPDYRGGTARRVLDGTLDVSALQPGDLLFFHTNPNQSSPSHVGMYAGGGMMVHAANSRKPIEEVPLDTQYYRSNFVGAVRITPDSSDGGGGGDTFDA